MKPLVALVAALLLALMITPIPAQQCYSYQSTYAPTRAYTAPRTYAPAQSYVAEKKVFRVDIAEVNYNPYAAYQVKDVFVFYGAPPKVPPGQVSWVNEKGQELRVMPPPAPGTGMPPLAGSPPSGKSRLEALADQDEGASSTSTAAAPAGDLLPRALAFLGPKCAECHKAGGKIKGRFTLLSGDGFAAGVDWKKVLGYAGGPSPSCPPGGGPLTPQQQGILEQLAR